MKKIENLIPFVSENFITFPLLEEGKYIPFVNIWRIFNTVNERLLFNNISEKVFENSGYTIELENVNSTETRYDFIVYPEFDELDDGGYKCIPDGDDSVLIDNMIDKIASVFELYDSAKNDANKQELINTEQVNRVEVIDQLGRSYVNWQSDNKVKLETQDDGKTLKIFITKK